MSWLRLSVDTGRDAVDWVCGILAAADLPGDMEVGPVSGAVEGGPEWRLTLLVRHDGAAGRLVDRLEEALAPLRRAGLIGELRVEQLPDRPEARDPVAARRIGRLVLLGPEQAHPGRDGDLTLRIGLGPAFGSGFHPATVASLHLLERHVRPGIAALDLGSGSGILSVALAKLGARVVALDNDPTAVEATQEAVRRNGVEPRVTVARGSLGQGRQLGHWMGGAPLDDAPPVDDGAGFDLVVANILARVHMLLAGDYRAALRGGTAPGGVLITAGFTVDQEEDVAMALAESGFHPLDREQVGEYVALAHRAALDEAA